MPIVTIDPKKANPKALCILTFAPPLIILLLSFFLPFMRNIFAFGSFVLMALFILGALGTTKDAENGVKRTRPEKNWSPPSWFAPVYFLTVIGICAGLKIAWFFTAIAWIVIWICFEIIGQAIEKTYKNAEKPLDPCHPYVKL